MKIYLCVATLILAGCASAVPPLADGSSARGLIEAQRFDREAANRNGTRLPRGTDPDRASAAIRSMRESATVVKESWQTTGGVTFGE